MVELNGQPRIKLSQDVAKVTIPGKKDIYRLYGEAGYALIDILQRSSEDPPSEGRKVLCRYVCTILIKWGKNILYCARQPSISRVQKGFRYSIKSGTSTDAAVR